DAVDEHARTKKFRMRRKTFLPGESDVFVDVAHLNFLNVVERGDASGNFLSSEFSSSAGNSNAPDQFSIFEQRHTARRTRQSAECSHGSNRSAVRSTAAKHVGRIGRRIFETIHVGERHVRKIHTDERTVRFVLRAWRKILLHDKS